MPSIGQLAGGLPYEEEAFRYGVDPDVSCEELEAVIRTDLKIMVSSAPATQTVRNLLRGYLLRMSTGQAIAYALQQRL